MTRPRQPWDIAIIGMACRFPGAVDPRAFWDNLVRGVESVAFFSDEELRAAGEDAELLRHPHYVKAGPILEAHDGFDAAFFGYAPREARLMDPQHRLFLEVAWQTFEDAGYDPLGANGIVGVYAGAGGLVSSYMVRLAHPDLRGQTGDLGHIGNDRDFLCSRVSFKLDLTGPSVNVQSACSTSLLAVHLACRALCDGEADMALAGASVIRVPHIRGYLAEPGTIYSPDGHCRAFDERAGGTLFGSGVGAVLLKPLAAARADGDHVYAVIKGTAINNDGGQKLSYTASTAAGQTRAAVEAMAIANVEPDTIGYVECHGAATSLGDPVEIQALTRAFRIATPRTGFCAIGSVKSNVGHLEQCAGMAGLMKAVLALQHDIIPASLHFETPNPRMLIERSPFFVNTAPRPFAHGAGPRRAGVNSVGMGGTNTFLVLEEAPPADPRPRSGRPMFILNASAQTTEALGTQVDNLRSVVACADADALRDLCFTANRGRHHFAHRFSAVGRDRDELLAELDRAPRGARASGGAKGKGRKEPIVFMFSGQGAQYARMGEDLARDEPVFRTALHRCLASFAGLGIPVAEALFDDDETRLNRTLYAQPALFSLQIALTELWASWGVVPAVVIGHSVGEFAAAVAAGACSVEQAARLVAARAQLMEALPERGGMVSIGADLETVQAAWPEGRDDLAVAAVNAPDRIVASGGAAALATLADTLRQRGVAVMEIKASHAFHSALMDPMLEAFEAIARSVSFERPRICWISTLTGEEIARAPDAQYWRDQIRGAVRFRAAIETAAQSPATYLEIGPGATLVNLGRRCLKRAEPAGDAVEWASSLSQESGEWSALLNAVRQLHLRGHAIRYEAFEPGNGRRVSLPTYPFQHRRWWLEPRPGGPPVAAPVDLTRAGTAHPFLGERLGGEDIRFEALLDLERLSFLSDHRVFGRVVLPTTAVLETVLAAAVKSLGFSRPAIADFLYEGAVTIPPDRPIWVQLALDPSGARTAFRLESTAIDDGDDWHLNVTGTLRDDMDAVEPPPFPSHALLSDCQDILPSRFYRFLASKGLSYGPAFQGITGLWRRDDEAFARVVLPREVDEGDYLLHPAFLDACLHLYSALVRKFGTFDEDGAADANVYVPIGLESFHLYRAGVRAGWVHAITVLREGEDEARLKVDVRVYGEDGRAVALFRGVTIRETTHDQFAAPEEPGLQPFLYRLTWREASRPEEPAALARHWCLLADAGGVGRHLADSLRAEQCSADLLTADQLAGLTASCPDPDIADPSPFEALLERAPGESVGVVYLWALDTPPDLADDPPTPRALALGGGACVGLLKALDRARSRFRTPPRLWLVTRGAQAEEIGTTPVAVAQSPLWGLGRTIALEYPDLWGGLIDLPAEGDARTAAELLLSELKGWGAEDQIAVRRDRRLAARLVRAPIETLPPRRRLAEDATYWIVGGLGAVGLLTAEALVAAGARHLVLTGRHPSRAGGAAALEELRRRAEIVVMASDATSESEVGAVLEHVRERMPPLKGVIHAAAVFDDAVLANVTGEQFQRVLAPKVAGAWRVSRATRALDLDFFVVFSSVLSLWGGLGQSAYTAANSFVDAIAAFRRAAGLPATVFNWGPWAVAGFAERWGPAGAALWKQRGTSRLSVELSLDVLLRFLDGPHPQVVVCDTRWGDFLGQFPDVPPLFRELARGAERVGAEGSAGEAPESLVELVQWHVARVLGEDGPIPASQPLNEIGLDSLLTVTLANRLRQALKVPVPTAMLLKGPSIVGLIAELFPDASPPKALAGASNGSTARVAGDGWLIFPRPRTDAAIRLLCFPFAGGGAATYRPWTRYLDERIELVAIEPPGRQTRLDELPLRDLPTLVKQLLPALRPLLDKPFAVYGHCFGALVLFETVRALIREFGVAPAHVFVSGARPPDELHRQQEFEVKLLERLLKIPGYSVFTPIHSQPEEVFAEAILQFDIMATETFLNDPELRRLILPVTRADFEMSAKYRYTPEPPWDIPITCLTGLRDTYVSPENARSWSRFTRRRFQLFMVDTEHFLVVDDDQFVISVLNRELGHPV